MTETDQNLSSQTVRKLIWKRFRRHPGAIMGCIVLGLIILSVIFAGLSPYNPEKSDINSRYLSPSLAHPMGTDALGRDLFTRVLYGGRVSLTVGLSVMVITLLIGVPVGATAGFFGGNIDNILMRITDAALSLPSLLVLILLSAMLREIDAPFLKNNPVLTIAGVIGLLAWMFTARLVRASYLAIREMDYVTATKALGASNLRVIILHILPNAIGPVIVESTLEVAYAILEESGLSYLGFGIQPPTPSWGNLLSNATEYLVKYPWLAIFPGIMIFLSVISINYIGDGLRDAFDPYKVLAKMGEV
jgi:peptide/nickel transport system permease protein